MNQKVRLTQTVTCGGCAGKTSADDLDEILAKLNIPNHSNILVGFNTGDDACVYKQNENNALVFTTDFIAPLIDNPFDFGKVAAANALSDIYAMGGEPILALNIACFDERLDKSIMQEILLGGAAICREANTILCGGHTVKAPETRYGLAVLGQVHPDKIITNSNGDPDDILILTKSLGTGILSQALKYGLLSDELENLLTKQLCQLNDGVMRAMQKVGVRCATDVTGFGLAGHLHKLTSASNCGAEIYIDKIPSLPEATELASDNIHSGILRKNMEFVEHYLTGNYLEHPKSKLIFDPQTSGGMLIAVKREILKELSSEFNKNGINCFEIGKLCESEKNQIRIVID
jgi:selenide,water dikinase